MPQIFWTSRALLVPVLAGLGSADAFAGARNVQDIVLNSVAIGFVFELDEFLYASWIPKVKREAFERAPVPPTAANSSRQGLKLVSAASYFIFVIDVAFLIWYYVLRVFQRTSNPSLDDVEVGNYFATRTYVLVRAFGFALSQSALALSTGRVKRYGRWRVARGTVVMGLLVLVSAAVSYTVLLAGMLDGHLGHQWLLLALDEIGVACLFGEGEVVSLTEEQCMFYNRVPGIYRNTTLSAWSMLSGAGLATGSGFAVDRMAMAWGVRAGYAPPNSTIQVSAN